MNKSIVQAVRDHDYLHNWMRVEVKHGSDTLVLLMSHDALKDGEGIRLSCSPKEMGDVCEILKHIPGTPWLHDHRFMQSCYQNEPQPKWYPGGRGMNEAKAVELHSRRVDKAIDYGRGSVGAPGKFWVAPLALENLYGGHVLSTKPKWKTIKLYSCVAKEVFPELRVFQARSDAHTGRDDDAVENTHEDYMMTYVVCCREAEKNGEPVDLLDLMRAGDPLVWGPEDFTGSTNISPPELYRGIKNREWVKAWQARMISLGLSLKADGDFGPITHDATKVVQAMYEINPTGRVTAELWEATETPIEMPDEPIATFPPLSFNGKQLAFGEIRYKLAPLANNPENIVVTNGWTKRNIVRVKTPMLAQFGYKAIYVHKTVAHQFLGFFTEIEETDQIQHIETVEGFWVPRLIRGRTTLSSHAHGTAFDINYRWNMLGHNPADWWQKGTVKPLVETAQKWGFYWGGLFSRNDGNHFEIGQVL